MVDAPFDVAVAPDGDVYISDAGNARIRRVDAHGFIQTVAGQVTAPEMGPFASAKLHAPSAMAWLDTTSSYLVAGGTSGRVFRADMANGVVSAVVGEPGGWDDGKDPRVDPPAVTASISRLLGDASGIAFDPREDTFYLSERAKNAIRKLRMIDTASPSTWTIEPWLTEIDGLSLDGPSGLAFDPLNGILWVADGRNHVVRGIDVDRAREVLRVGHAGELGLFGGDGSVDVLFLDGPEALALSADGRDLYIADTGNHRVLRVVLETLTETASVSIVLGGRGASGVDGQRERDSAVRAPRGLAIDAYGNLFITSTNGVRVVNPARNRGVADGDGTVRTIYGAADAARFPMSVTNCLTGIHVDASTVHVLDACQGFMLELERNVLGK